jgi:hypothetical protein
MIGPGQIQDVLADAGNRTRRVPVVGRYSIPNFIANAEAHLKYNQMLRGDDKCSADRVHESSPRAERLGQHTA